MNQSLKPWRISLLCAIGFLSTTLHGQVTDQPISSKGISLWCAFLENLDLAWNDAPNFAFQIEAEHDVTGTVLLAGTGLSIPFTVAAGTIATIDMPQAIYYPQGSESVTDYGILITASDSIQVKALHWRLYFSETSGVLPASELGNHYLAQCYRYHEEDESAFIIVATEDQTTVTITPSTITLNARPAGIPFTVQLNRGQTYQVQSFEDLTGTDIQSPEGKPIAVFGGAKTSDVECISANSHLYDQCLPLDRDWFWGRRFFAIPFYGQPSSVIRVLASEDSTIVYSGCDQVATLNKGETWTSIFNTATILYAGKPVAVSQMARGVACSGAAQIGDPMQLNLLPEGVYARKAAAKVPLRTSNHFFFATNIMTVIAKAGQSGDIRLNGGPLNYPHTPLGAEWEYTRFFVHPDSTYHLESDVTAFQAYLHGLDYANAYANWVGFDRVELDTVIEDIGLLAPDSVCVDSIFSISVQGGDLQSLELHSGGIREQLTSTQLILHQAGTAIFSATVQAPGFCQPQLVYAKTMVIACPPPPDTCPLQVPNVFTPNGDQLNDVFKPVHVVCSFSEYQLTVYNRWGQRVFSSNQSGMGWDGKTDGQDAPSDVYIWTLGYQRYPGAGKIVKKGQVSLLR